MMKNLKSVVVAVLFLSASAAVWAKDQMTLVTYFPVPQGEHESFSSQGNTYLAVEDGKVGIGTDQPTAKLTVKGDVRVKGPAAIGGDLAVGKSLTAHGVVRATGGLRIQNVAAEDVASVGSVWLNSKKAKAS